MWNMHVTQMQCGVMFLIYGLVNIQLHLLMPICIRFELIHLMARVTARGAFKQTNVSAVCCGAVLLVDVWTDWCVTAHERHRMQHRIVYSGTHNRKNSRANRCYKQAHDHTAMHTTSIERRIDYKTHRAESDSSNTPTTVNPSDGRIVHVVRVCFMCP